MRKLLLTLMAFAVVSLAALADKPTAAKKQFQSVLKNAQVQKATVSEIAHPYVRKVPADRNVVIQSMQKVDIMSDKTLPVDFSSILKSESAHPLEGIYDASGYNLFDEEIVEWLVLVEQDAVDEKKFWFTNLIEDAFTEKVYGTLSGNKMSIPADQLAIIHGSFANAGWAGYLVSMKGTSGSFVNPVEASVNISTGLLTFTTGFAVYIWDDDEDDAVGYYDAIGDNPAVVFTNQNGGTGEESEFAPESLYLQPVGTLYNGMSSEGYSYDGIATYAHAPAYSTWTFKNITETVSEEQTNIWDYIEYISATEEIPNSSAATDLVMVVTNGAYIMPELHTCIREDCTSYIHGASYNNPVAYIYSGGGTIWTNSGTIPFGLTNANPDYRYGFYTNGDGYLYGTGNSALRGLISYYQMDPNRLIYFEGISVMFGALTGPADTELRLEIVKASKSGTGGLVLGDLIAVATTTIGDAQYYSTSGAIVFDEFFALDEFGFEAPLDYLEIEGSFALILTGYNDVPGVVLGVISEIDKRPDTERYDYLLGTDGKIYTWNNAYHTMSFILEEAYYTYLVSETTEIAASEAGGNYAVKLVPYFNGAWVENELPDWIDVTFEDNFVQGDWHTMATIAVENSPTTRSFDIEFATWGARHIITVSQGFTDLPALKAASDAKVVKRNDSFDLNYSPDYTGVSVYNLAGQKVAGYKLPSSGTFTIPAGNYSKGVYLISFTGTKGASTLKVMK